MLSSSNVLHCVTLSQKDLLTALNIIIALWNSTKFILVCLTVTVTERYLHCAPTGRPRAHHKTNQISMFPGVRTQTQTKMFSVFYKTSLSTAAAWGLSAACSMHVVQQQRKLCRRFVDMPRYDEVAARRGTQCKSCRCTSATGVSKSEMCSVQEAPRELAKAPLVLDPLRDSATLGQLESHGHAA